MLLELKNGDLIPLSRIERFIVMVDGENPPYYRVMGEREEFLGNADMEIVKRTTATIIPATPGWRVAIISGYNNETFDMLFKPVIAWRLDEWNPVPITPDGPQMQISQIVISPSGDVSKCQPLYRFWASLDEATQALEREWQEEKKLRKET